MVVAVELADDDYLGLADVSYKSRVVDEEVLEAATTEKPFDQEAFDVLKELEQSVKVVAGLGRLDSEGKPRTLGRNEAILAGQMVRCWKLQQGLIQCCDPERLELFNFFQRGVVETAVNLRYLIEKGTPELFDSYVRSGLRADRELYDRITANVELRGGILQPIEHRMLEGIERSFKTADVELDSVSATGSRQWSPGGVKGRFDALGLGELYEPFFAAMSQYTHGSWHDIYAYHLTKEPDGGFLPQLRWGAIRPQPLLGVIDVLASAATSYLEDLGRPGSGRDTLADRIGFCATKGQRITELHEAFLQRGQSHP